MEIKQLEYFVQLCNHKTFSQAAENLFLTHQGLNKSIRCLEEELGVSLYWKDKHRIVLTEAGEEFCRQAKHILEETAILKEKMAGFADKSKKQTISIAAAYAVYGELYPLIFSALKEAFPQVQFKFSEYPDLICEKAVINEEADIGFTIGPFQNSTLVTMPLLSHRLCVLVNDRHPFAGRDDLSCSDLQKEEIIIANENFKIYHIFKEQCRLLGFEPNIVFMGSEISSIHSLVKSNRGIAVTVDFVGHYPGCKTIPLEPAALDWTIHMIALKHHMSDPSLHNAVSLIERIVRAGFKPL